MPPGVKSLLRQSVGGRYFFVLWLFLYHIVLLCCLAFNIASCFGSVGRGDNIAPSDPFRRVAFPQHNQTTL
jgi:hypothetical protein